MANPVTPALSPQLELKIREWLTWDRNPKTLDRIRRLNKAHKFEELEQLLMTRLKFGTAGLRGKLGAGYNAMNDLVVVQTAQGLLRYLEDTDFATLKHSGIVIGYDGRHGSKRYECNLCFRCFKERLILYVTE